MYSEYKTPDRKYFLKTHKFICNRFGLAEFFSQHYGEFGSLGNMRALDVGCGAFPLGIFLADQFQCNVTGVEMNPVAYRCAENNIESLNLKNKVSVVHENFTAFLEQYDGEGFDIIVSNPPVDDKVAKDDVLKYADSSFERLDEGSFSFLTNSWKSAEGKDLIDYIFEFGEKNLKDNGRIIIVFCTMDCDSPEYVYRKAEDYGYKVFKVVEGYITAESIGVESLGIEKVNTFMVEFRR